MSEFFQVAARRHGNSQLVQMAAAAKQAVRSSAEGKLEQQHVLKQPLTAGHVPTYSTACVETCTLSMQGSPSAKVQLTSG